MRHGLAWSCVIGGLLVGMTEGRAPAPGPGGPALDKVTLAEVRNLQEQRRDLLRDLLERRTKLYQAARCTLGELIDTSKQLLTVELDLAETAAERIAAYERYLEKAQGRVELAEAHHAAARGSFAEVLEARDAVLAAKIGLLKAGGKPKKAEK
jgi:outer membrane protein TolC